VLAAEAGHANVVASSLQLGVQTYNVTHMDCMKDSQKLVHTNS
jgi:hypothetical protein